MFNITRTKSIQSLISISSCRIAYSKIENLRECLEKEITAEESKKRGVIEKFKAWNYYYSDVQVEGSSKQQGYDIKVLFNAKSPQTMQEQQGGEEDLLDVAVFIKKESLHQKWLKLQFAISQEEQKLMTVNFIEDYQKEKKTLMNFNRNINGDNEYHGPKFFTLDQKLIASVKIFLESLGVDSEFLLQTRDISEAHEAKFYLEWLKDFKSLV